MMTEDPDGFGLGIEHSRSAFGIGARIALKVRVTVLASWLIAGILAVGVAHADTKTCPSSGFIDCTPNRDFLKELHEALDFFDDIGGWYSKAKSVKDVVEKVLSALGYIEIEEKLSDFTRSEFIEVLREELDRVIGALDWKLDYQSYADRYGAVYGAFISAKTAIRNHEPLDRHTFMGWQPSLNAVVAAGVPEIFMREFRSTKTSWMDIITDKPNLNKEGLIYDWRLALPAYLQLVALRLQVIAAVDPMFRTAVAFGTKSTSAYIDELMPMRATMDNNYHKISENLKCGTKAAAPVFVGVSNDNVRFSARVVCADINTDLAVEYDPEIVYPASSHVAFAEAGQHFADTLEIVRRNLQSALESLTPLFDLKSFSNSLSMYLDTSLRDLTDPNHLIRSDDNGSCVVLINPIFADPNSDAGFAISASVGLGSCTSAYARWTYDRASGLITSDSADELSRHWGGNGVCLRAVPWDILAPNIPVGVQDCGIARDEDPRGRTMKWTYDPNARTLISGAGGLLSWANLSDQNGASIGSALLLSRTPTPSTQWGSTWTCSDAAIVKSSFGKHRDQTSFDSRADVNGDGVVDVKDLALVAQLLPGGVRCP